MQTTPDTPKESEPLLLPAGNPFVKKYAHTVLLVLIAVIFAVFFFIMASLPPRDFPMGSVINVPKNATISEVAASLKSHSLIRSETVFKVFALITGGQSGAMSGDYMFVFPTNVWTVAHRITNGIQGLARVRVTFPEGSTVADMATILGEQIVGFDKKTFLEMATSSEGYLFPDTYYFFINAKPEDVLKVVRAEFDQKYALIRGENAVQAGIAFHKPTEEIITMASIVEKEAINQDDREIVSGVLWNRINKGMLLQVDPPFEYFLNKSSDQLTYADLKVESPYNTYLHKGLPPGPINNPGSEALRATMMPTPSSYFFYLSDKKGMMHYAKTYAEHLENRAKYLGK